MLEAKNAYEILGVKENASRDEIVRRYDILLKKYRAGFQGDPDSHDGTYSFEEISEAYNFIMGYETGEPVEEKPQRTIIPGPILRKLNVDEKKVNNFFYYHKNHIIIGILAVLIIAYSLKGCIGQVKPDLNIAYMGDFVISNQDILAQNVKSAIPELKAVGVDGAVLSGKSDSEQDIAMQQKAMILFAAADVDVFILDRTSFERFGKQNAFLSLDDMVDVLKIDRTKNKANMLKANEDTTEHLYGIDVTGSSVFKGTGIESKGKIAAVSVRVKYRDNANKLLASLINN